MKYQLRKRGIACALTSAAILAACSGDLDHPMSSEDSDEYASDEYAADEDGVVLGTLESALMTDYPKCLYTWSDPERDGWGWENNRTCIVEAYFPTCQTTTSDPDRDGWGWENNRNCKVRTTTYTAPTYTAPTYTAPTYTAPTSSTCSNQEGVYATMAALAVSAAMEMKRWQPSKDFVIGRIGYDEALFISSTGKARCSDGVCANTQALLDFQKNEANNQIVFPGNVAINSGALRSRLVAKYKDQVSCERQPSNGGTTNCPVEEHTLTFQRSEKGGCDTNYFFLAKKTDGSPLQYPGQLKNKLLWADPVNPYVAFQNVGEVISIDPTYGLNEAGSSSTGSCSTACARISSSNLTGQCCSCNGASRVYSRAFWSSVTYLCK